MVELVCAATGGIVTVPDGQADALIGRGFERVGAGAPTLDSKADEIREYAQAHGIGLGGAKSKRDMLAIISEAGE